MKNYLKFLDKIKLLRYLMYIVKTCFWINY